MAYYSGTASSLSNLLTALRTHAQADGWTLTGDVLSKAGVYFRVYLGTYNIGCRGCEDNALANPAPNDVMIGRMYINSGYPTREITFPCNYEVFGFAQELYFIVNYDTDSYQWMAFGKSTVPSLPGQGGWCGATIGGNWATVYEGPVSLMGTPEQNILSAANPLFAGCVLFGTTHTHYSSGAYASSNSWCNSNLDGHGWLPSSSGHGGIGFSGLETIQELLWQQPAAWNSEAILMPIRAWKLRAAWKNSLVADLEHARHIRIDNLAPGDVLTLGADRWKVFPWYRKNSAERNGGHQVNHTGTFGWAIRYEGP